MPFRVLSTRTSYNLGRGPRAQRRLPTKMRSLGPMNADKLVSKACAWRSSRHAIISDRPPSSSEISSELSAKRLDT
jgi:hypothetical protein